MTINEIKELIQLIDQTSINDFQYQKDGYKIKIKKNHGEVHAYKEGFQSQVYTEKYIQETPTTKEKTETNVPSQVEISEPVAVKESTEAFKTLGGKEVKSPLVGVYYASPSPTSPAFIEVGSAVKKGDVLCIVEAMKIMNEIVAENDGVVTEICVENETLVEYGQTLVRIG